MPSFPSDQRNSGRRPWYRVPYPWIVVAVATLSQGGSNWPIQAFPVLFPSIQDSLGLTRTEVGFIISALAGGGFTTIYLGGVMADSFGVRRVLGFTLILLAVPLALISATHALWEILVLGVVAGMLQAPGFPASSRAILEWLPAKSRGLAMGIKQTGTPIAGIIASVALPAIAVASSWRVSVLVLAGMVLFTGVVFTAVYRDRAVERPSRHQSMLGGLKDLMKNRTLMLVTIWGMLFSIFSIVVGSYLALFLVERAGLSLVVAGGFVGVARVGSVAGRVLWGAASDYLFGSRRIAVMGMMGAITAAGLLGAALIGPGTSPFVITVVAFVLGSTSLAWRTVFIVLVGELAGTERTGTVLGSASTFMTIGSLSGAPLFGFLVDFTESYATVWTGAGIAAALSTMVLILVARDPKRD